MPLYRRLPKRGFHNRFGKKFAEVNLGNIQRAINEKKLDGDKPISADVMLAAGLVRRLGDGIRLLAQGEFKSKVTIEVVGASKAAISAVEGAGGKVILPVVTKPTN